MQNTSPPELFCEKRLTAIRQRARRINKEDAGFLAQIAAETIGERLDVTNRDFAVALDLFSLHHGMARVLGQSRKVTDLISLTRPGEECLSDQEDLQNFEQLNGTFGPLPLASETVNLVTSVFGLHWCNDLPGMFAQIRKSLAPDGLFMCVLPGERTLVELRECLLEAETGLSGSASLRVDPFSEVRQLGGLLQRAGFTLPVADTEILTVRYASVRALIEDLRAMGNTSALKNRARFGPRSLFDETEKLYRKRYADEDGRIRATFELVFLSGWAPHPSQQTALKPGSAKNHLKDFL